jgi:uncharacterized membrane protein HdeD (DUF308 family)
MLRVTNLVAILLIALGSGAFIASSSPTALLPAYVGVALLALGVLSIAFVAARKHLMHIASLVALLGALAPAAALAIRAAQMSTLALTVNLGMLALCAALFVLQISFFLKARRTRAAAL